MVYKGIAGMRPFLSAWSIFLVALLCGALLVPGRLPKLDFSCFYTAGILLRTNPSRLYDPVEQQRVYNAVISDSGKVQPFLQPAFTAAFYAPFSLLPYRIAYTLFFLCNFALLIPCFRLAHVEFSHFSTWQPRPGLSFFVFVPLLAAAGATQLSILILLVSCAAWHELKRGRALNAGLCLALGLVKFQVALPLTFLLAIRYGRRLVAGFAGGALILTGFSFLLTGVQGTAGFIQALRLARMARIPTVMPNLRGLIYVCGARYLADPWQMALTLALSATLLLWVAWLVHREGDDAVAFALSIIAALLLSYHLMLYDLTLVLLATGLLRSRRRAYSYLTSACFVLPALLFFLLPDQMFWVIALPLLGFLFLISEDQDQLARPFGGEEALKQVKNIKKSKVGQQNVEATFTVNVLSKVVKRLFRVNVRHPT